MKPKTMGRIFAAVLCLAAQAAHASAEVWSMSEVYSNSDGTIQFLELETLSDGGEFLTGEKLMSAFGGTTNYFTFPNDLAGFSQGKKLLMATQGFANLGVVAPDYVVPDGFFSTGGGVIVMGFVDQWNYPPLPADGSLSLSRDGTTATNSPTNYAGDTGSVRIAPGPNFQALWWGSPAGSESGWGVNITQQGNIMFATWFTYDLDGSAMWLVASDVRRTSGNTFTGPLYRTTGPAFSDGYFDPQAVGVTRVGSATFTFSAADAGTFSYVVNGISQSKPITRQVYDLRESTCTSGGTAGSAPNYQDLWWRAPAGSESGWGVNITHQGDILFATWFTYDASGKGMWIVMPDGQLGATAGTYAGKLYRTTGAPFNASPWNPASVTVIEVGAGSFSFSSTNAGIFSYTVNGLSQSKVITRQVYSSPTTVCG